MHKWNMTQNYHSPCFTDGQPCDERTSTCHIHCESYIKWKAERDARLAEEHEAKVKANRVNDVMSGHKKRIQRNRGMFKLQGVRR